MKKKSMWYLTIFSLVLILGVYYVCMPNELLEGKITSDEVKEEVTSNVTENSILVAMRANRNEELDSEKEKLENKLTDDNVTTEEKNIAFEELKVLNLNITKESEMESIIEEEFGIKSYIEINNDEIKVVINSSEHDTKLANDIMRCIQSEYTEKMYISVEFK